MLATTRIGSSCGGGGAANQPLVTLLALTLSLALIVARVECNGPNFSDCMKNPFATGCRGISAKRSVGGAGELSPSLELLAGEPTDMGEPSGAPLRHWLEALKARAKLENGDSFVARQRPNGGQQQQQQQPPIELVQIFMNDQPAATIRARQRAA